MIAKIDACLMRYLGDMRDCDVKLADYTRLTELEEMIAEQGGERTVMRWVTSREKSPDELDR